MLWSELFYQGGDFCTRECEEVLKREVLLPLLVSLLENLSLIKPGSFWSLWSWVNRRIAPTLLWKLEAVSGEALTFRRASSPLNCKILSAQVLYRVWAYRALTWKPRYIDSLTCSCYSLLILNLHSWGFHLNGEKMMSFQHPINLWTLARKYVFCFELSCAQSLLIIMTLLPAFEPVSPGKCTDRCVVRHFLFSQLSQPSLSQSWSLWKRISRRIAKNYDNLMIIVSQSVVQFVCANQSYPKDISSLIYLMSTGSFSRGKK